jgi:hypothetical protein
MAWLAFVVFSLIFLNFSVSKKYVDDYVEDWTPFEFVGLIVSFESNESGHNPFNSFEDIWTSGSCITVYVKKSPTLFNFTLTCNAPYSELKPMPYNISSAPWITAPKTLLIIRRFEEVDKIKRLGLYGRSAEERGRILLQSVNDPPKIAYTHVVYYNYSCSCNYRNEFLINYGTTLERSENVNYFFEAMKYGGPIILLCLLIWIIHSIIKM